MKIKQLEKKGDRIKFTIEGINHVFANTLRRLIMGEVPVMAIDEVEFHKNDSLLYDEVLAHRLSLVPILTDLKSYNLKSVCRCKGKGCQNCQLKISLKLKGPCSVYAKDLKFRDKKIKAIHPDLLIVKLMDKQELEFVATAVLGGGKQHSKFSPGLSYYQKYPLIKIDQRKFNRKMAEHCVEVCPTNVFSISGNKLKVDETKCTLCNACMEICKTGFVNVQGADNKFIFNLESWGQLKPKEIVEQAIKVFNAKLETFRKDVSAIKK